MTLLSEGAEDSHHDANKTYLMYIGVKLREGSTLTEVCLGGQTELLPVKLA